MFLEHFVGSRTQSLETARCGRKLGGAFCWFQIVHANSVTTTRAARNQVQVLCRYYGTGTNILGLHEK
jgi:hypothetical protein